MASMRVPRVKHNLIPHKPAGNGISNSTRRIKAV